MSLQFTPGYYCKVRIDDTGQIVDTGELEVQDLPAHSHGLEDLINEEELTNKIADILSTFFANNGGSSVIFEYDKNTRTVTADVNIDGESIVKNEWGQLASSVTIINNQIVDSSGSDSDNSSSSSESSSGSSNENSQSSSNSSVSFSSAEIEEDVRRLNEKLDTLEASVPEILYKVLSEAFANSAATAVDFEWDNITHTVSAEVNVDGISISKDENGDLIATGAVVGSGENGNCASHTHLSSQIEDFEDAVVNIFNDYSKNITFDLENIIDGTTIKINQYGQLTAVSTAIEKHTHTIADIVDFPEIIPAAKQMLSPLGEDVVLDDGVLDFTNLSIGYSLLAINKYLKEVVAKNITNILKKLEELSAEKDNTVQGELTVAATALSNHLLDSEDSTIKLVYYGKTLKLALQYLPYSSGKINLLINGELLETTDIDILQSVGDYSKSFTVSHTQKKNDYTARILSIDVAKYISTEGYYTFQITYETEQGKDSSNKLETFVTPYRNLNFTFEDTTAKHAINGKTFYNYPEKLAYEITIENYANYRFVPADSNFTTTNGVLSAFSPKRVTGIYVTDLFERTLVPVNFDLELEHSTSDLIKYLTVSNGGIINDFLEPSDSSTPYTAEFQIPLSKGFNTLQIESSDENFDIKDFTLIKGKYKAIGNIEADELNPGFIKVADSCYDLTFANVYDNGKTDMKLVLSTTKKINLNKLRFSTLNLL